jgi:CheY-like chemotaxis protein
MADRSQHLEHSNTRALSIYPPGWYLDLVRLRLCSRAVESSDDSAMAGVYHVPTASPDRDSPPSELPRLDSANQIQLLALALEIVRAHGLDQLSLDDQMYLLGFDVPEAREYLRSIFEKTGVPSSASTLIIEDEAAVALDLVRIVRQTGHQVCGTAARLDQAIAVAARMRPALVLADVQLRDGPEAGITAVREIRRSGETPVVYVTAYPERVKDDAPDALVISKPFAANEIQTAMWRALYRQGHHTPAAA